MQKYVDVLSGSESVRSINVKALSPGEKHLRAFL